MWPFKKKRKEEIARNIVWSNSNSLAVKCINDDPDVDTVVGYKDNEGRFFDSKDAALASNKQIENSKKIKDLEKVLQKLFPRNDEFDIRTHRELFERQLVCEFAKVLHDNPGILKDYLNENY